MLPRLKQRGFTLSSRNWYKRKLSSFTYVFKMVNGKWLPDFIERLKASAWHQLYLPLLPFTHARSESINADSLKLQLLTARKKEWWPATAGSLPPGGLPDNCETHCVSGNWTHDLPIVSPTCYQLCHRDRLWWKSQSLRKISTWCLITNYNVTGSL